MAIILRITPKEPISFYTRAIKTYYYTTKDYIPATTLRGALLESYLRNSGDLYKKISDFYVSPAFPLNSAPSHPFLPAISRKSEDFVEEPNSLQIKNLQNDLERTLNEIKEKYSKDQYPKPKTGTIVKLENTNSIPYKYKSFGFNSIINMHVAINKFHGASESGMLFAYEYKEVGDLWAIASEDLGVNEAYIGKSRYKGAGKVEVKKVKEYEIPNPNEGDWAYCLSPCIEKFLDKSFFEYEEALGKEELYNAWFTYKDLMGRKPLLKVLSPGSIVKIKKIYNIDELKPAGLNFIIKINDLGSFLRGVQ
ncbi:hypothetical protein [Acidianus brierleyi]|uniref:Uncharacterized protein n=1 Tax=Acidianus brierleyi TaxID=41673 RepID=A0A2U9IHG7_9CREN|nr:hypothetical protein [Acidianus brierleyi]AWR95460.1 hypothetical protein DFR85_13525 [Acidianus brierleyi]